MVSVPTQRSLSGDPRRLVAISGNRGNQWQSVAISGNQWQSVITQWRSEAIGGIRVAGVGRVSSFGGWSSFVIRVAGVDRVSSHHIGRQAVLLVAYFGTHDRLLRRRAARRPLIEVACRLRRRRRKISHQVPAPTHLRTISLRFVRVRQGSSGFIRVRQGEHRLSSR